MFSGTNYFSFFLFFLFGGRLTKNGFPQKGFPFNPRVTEQLSEVQTSCGQSTREGSFTSCAKNKMRGGGGAIPGKRESSPDKLRHHRGPPLPGTMSKRFHWCKAGPTNQTTCDFGLFGISCMDVCTPAHCNSPDVNRCKDNLEFSLGIVSLGIDNKAMSTCIYIYV